jgi:hypothetical protein
MFDVAVSAGQDGCLRTGQHRRDEACDCPATLGWVNS